MIRFALAAATALVALAAATLYPPLALADALVAPVPAAVAFPEAAGHCFRAEVGVAALQELKEKNPASRAFAFIKGAQQDFADVWRGSLHLPTIEVHMTLAWLSDGTAAVSEFGPDGCLITATVMSFAQWNTIIAALHHSRGT